jgi:hypothetical protein
MKKKIYLTLVVLLALTTVKAQITITAPSVSIASQIDTFAVPDNPADFKPLAATQSNAHWDFTIAQYPNIQYFTLRTTTTSSNYPTSQVNHQFTTTFAGDLSFETIRYYNINNNSIVTLGEEVINEQIVPLVFVTGDIDDELIFPVQNMPYSAPHIEREFPVTLGSSFTSFSSIDTKFNLTVNAYGLNKVPGFRRTFKTTKDTVVGWGTVKIKGISTKKIYDNIPVLQVRHHVTMSDSFFLGGSPAPKPLLDAFGLQQGFPVDYYYVDFISQDELDELIRIDFAQNPYTNVSRVEIQQNRIEQYATRLNKLSLQNAINTYPNPIIDDNISIELPTNQTGNWGYNLTDIYGRNIANGTVNAAEGTIKLPAGIAAGSYILSIDNDGVTVSVNKILKQQ